MTLTILFFFFSEIRNRPKTVSQGGKMGDDRSCQLSMSKFDTYQKFVQVTVLVFYSSTTLLRDADDADDQNQYKQYSRLNKGLYSIGRFDGVFTGGMASGFLGCERPLEDYERILHVCLISFYLRRYMLRLLQCNAHIGNRLFNLLQYHGFSGSKAIRSPSTTSQVHRSYKPFLTNSFFIFIAIYLLLLSLLQ